MMMFNKADGIIDLRSFEAFKVSHLTNSTWMAWQDLPELLNELPASPASFMLVGEEGAIEEISIFLNEKNYQVIGSLVINDEADLRRWQEQLPERWEAGSQSKRLWASNPLLEAFSELIDLDVKGLRPSAVDLGCGGGRDSVYLAKLGWRVVGIDQEARVIKRAKQLANRAGAAVKWKCCDLKKDGCLPVEPVDLVVVMRFLNRDLFTQIRELVKPGGWIVFQTFAEGAEVFGSPKNPNFLLKPGELKEVFADFSVIIDKIDALPDGRPVASFIAQKPKATV
ncbi:class I SAM-dependent methyltransferase [Thiomicrorhabdus sp. ZW0627]|uniref:class I SAM-dependent methyltransferase n=1 Tax=Thiomicrorhabdus sp. ZW0627 TaxID=3039774 RepID=UPI0024369B84|nr:class I SAM-dependent methyltransferase [Thiomicrorhabdus sp. ZW0627]MDG6773085.1 class I SAM-dependent methyltransferase [Thiomicrorhabdus sp. ZW0627]